MRDIQQLHGTRRDSERQPATIGESRRHAAHLWERRESERQLETIGDIERHAATPWDQRDTERQPT